MHGDTSTFCVGWIALILPWIGWSCIFNQQKWCGGFFFFRNHSDTTARRFVRNYLKVMRLKVDYLRSPFFFFILFFFLAFRTQPISPQFAAVFLIKNAPILRLGFRVWNCLPRYYDSRICMQVVLVNSLWYTLDLSLTHFRCTYPELRWCALWALWNIATTTEKEKKKPHGIRF